MREYIERRYAHHPPVTESRIARHEQVRFLFASLADRLEDIVPGSREASLMQTALQEACLWANAAIAIYEDPAPETPETPNADPA